MNAGGVIAAAIENGDIEQPFPRSFPGRPQASRCTAMTFQFGCADRP
jgi:hypothetical protein